MISIRVLTEDRQRLFRINYIDYEWVFVSNDELMRPFFKFFLQNDEYITQHVHAY